MISVTFSTGTPVKATHELRGFEGFRLNIRYIGEKNKTKQKVPGNMGFNINWYVKFQNWPPQSSRRTLFGENCNFEEGPKVLFYHLQNTCDGVPLEV